MEIFNYDNRGLKILNILEYSFEAEDDYLVSILKVSKKTIINEVKSLNEMLETTAYIEYKNSKFTLYVIKLEEYLKKKKGIYKFLENFGSSKVRLVYIFKKLVLAKEGTLIDDLAFEMIVSRTTLNNDLKKLNEIISDYNLNISGKPNKGIYLVGLEKDIRIFILENIYSYVYKEDIFDKIDNHFFDKLFEKYNLDEQIKPEFLRYLTIALDRYANEFFLNFSDGEYDELLMYYTKDFMVEICDYLKDRYDIKLNDDEKKFITICFATMRVPTKITKIKTNIKYTNEYEDLVNEILNRVIYEFGLNFDISDMFEEFVYHIYFLMKRLKYGVRYRNNMKEKIREQYPISYKISKFSGDIIFEKYGYEISEDELGYLAVYFETFLTKIKSQDEKLRILIVTKEGPAYRELMIKKIHKLVSNSMIEVISPYINKNLKQFDVIISTEEKEFSSDIPVIYQNEIFDEKYLKKELNFLNYVSKINSPRVRGMESIIISSISEDTFFVCDKEKTYKENLEMMILNLIKRDIVDKEFLDRIREREKKSSMIFSDRLAFPHTINIGKDSFTIALGVSPDGFLDNRDLRLIFLACVPERTEQGLILAKTYDELMTLIKDEYIITNLAKVTTYNKLVNYIVKRTNLYR